ncbi:MAG: hypothetical protein LBM98_08450 [Oscillospiraceae bacterium]|nr:hypothetical protein [Oscillospiraceae bacterium]
MLRTCNALRIANLPVLRNDGAPHGAPRPCTLTPSKPSSSSPLWRGAPAGAGWFPRHSGRSPVQTFVPIPLCGGVPPQGRGGFPATADAPPSKPLRHNQLIHYRVLFWRCVVAFT